MSADLLRRAAALMRGRAEVATPGPWQALCDGYGDTSGGTAHEDRRDLLWVRSGETNKGDVVSTWGMPTADTLQAGQDVTHIASWHPAVAIAVANWLDSIAETHETDPDDYCGGDGHDDFTGGERLCASWWCATVNSALAVARAYLADAEVPA